VIDNDANDISQENTDSNHLALPGNVNENTIVNVETLRLATEEESLDNGEKLDPEGDEGQVDVDGADEEEVGEKNKKLQLTKTHKRNSKIHVRLEIHDPNHTRRRGR
jgi:hypothetical protein